MKQCPCCGTVLNDQTAVCNYCGFNLQQYYYQHQMAQMQAMQSYRQQSIPQGYYPQNYQPAQAPATQQGAQAGYGQYGQSAGYGAPVQQTGYHSQQAGYAPYGYGGAMTAANRNAPKKRSTVSIVLGIIFGVIGLVWFVLDGMAGFNMAGGNTKPSETLTPEETALRAVLSSEVVYSDMLEHIETGHTVEEMISTMFSEVDTVVKLNEEKTTAFIYFTGYYYTDPSLSDKTSKGTLTYTYSFDDGSFCVFSDLGMVVLRYARYITAL